MQELPFARKHRINTTISENTNMIRTFRRIFFPLLSVLALAQVYPVSVSAQRGEKTLGLAGGYASYNQSGFAAVYFQYSLAEHFRISPEAGYVFRNNGKTGFEFCIDMHFPFRIAKGIKIYPLAGITFNNWNYASDDTSRSRAGFDAGGGLDFYFTQQLKLSVQGKYSLMKDTHGAYVSLGLGYTF